MRGEVSIPAAPKPTKIVPCPNASAEQHRAVDDSGLGQRIGLIVVPVDHLRRSPDQIALRSFV